jgi:hypothetical protein
MSRRFILALLGAATLLCARHPAAAAQRLTISGGVAAPMSDLGDVADLGYVIAAGLNAGGTDRPIGARVEGSLAGFDLKRSSESARIISLTGNAVVNLLPGASSPYLIGGVGLYNSKFGDADSNNDIGVNLGGGLRFPLGSLRAFFEARYHAVLGNRRERPHLQYVPVTLGILL